MKYRSGLASALIALWLLAGCASSGPERDINDPGNSLVFGYIDMEDAPTSVDYASLVQVAPPSKTPYWGLAVRKGLFYSAYLPPGTAGSGRAWGSSSDESGAAPSRGSDIARRARRLRRRGARAGGEPVSARRLRHARRRAHRARAAAAQGRAEDQGTGLGRLREQDLPDRGRAASSAG